MLLLNNSVPPLNTVAKLLLSLLLLLECMCIVVADQTYGDRPRGVPAEKAALYAENSKELFQCLDGTKSIPYERVNDDYCDCEDGTDEPGTSACANGRFTCRNHGHAPLTVPASRVNDAICDCCDGADEWAAAEEGGVVCPNTCDAQGASARQAHDDFRALADRGWRRRVELAREGAASMDERRAEVTRMRSELDDLQPLRSAAEAQRDDTEARERDAKSNEDAAWNELVESKRTEEATSLFAKVDIDGDGKITIDDFKAAARTIADRILDDDTNAIDTVKRAFGDAAEMSAEQFREKLLDLRSFFRHRKIVEATTMTAALPDENVATELHPEAETDDVAAAKDDDDEEDDLSIEPTDAVDSGGNDDDGEEEDDAYSHERKPDYSETTKLLIEEANKHRDTLRDAQNKIADLERQIRDADNFLASEYGADHSWAPLKGQCVEMHQSEYTYRLCLFDRAVQKERHGSNEVGIGNWKEWEGEGGNDDDEAAAAKKTNYTIQRYTDGQHCWNGPQRSTRVRVECGDELVLIEAKEPSKCEYEFRLRAPAACPDPSTIGDPYAVHTEL